MLVTGGNDSLIKVWKISSSSFDETNFGQIDPIVTLKGHGCSLMSVRFAPKSSQMFASTSGDKTLRLWNSVTYACLRVLENHQRYVICCSFSPDGKRVATGSNDKTVNVWSIEGLLKPTESSQDSVQSEFVCPITQDLMRNPVKCSDGFVYERAAIQEWLVSRRQTSPMTNLPLTNLTLIPQVELQKKIRDSLKN